MKKVINGKTYNTDKATYVCGRSDNGAVESLYKTRTKNFFMYVDANARSSYREYYNDNDWSGATGIIELNGDLVELFIEYSNAEYNDDFVEYLYDNGFYVSIKFKNGVGKVEFH